MKQSPSWKSWIGSKHIPKLNKRTRGKLTQQYTLDPTIKQFIQNNGTPKPNCNWYFDNGELKLGNPKQN